MDLFVGMGREHGDLDIGCFRGDLGHLLQELPSWEVAAAVDGDLVRLDSDRASSAHSYWCRPPGSAAWWFEVMVEEREGGDWVYRRERSIRIPVSELTFRHSPDVRVIRPEVQLLYKSKARRKRDDLDFERALGRLSARAKQWLATSIETCSSQHPWLDYLRASAEERGVGSVLQVCPS